MATAIEQANSLFQAGRVNEGVGILRSAAAQNDAAALVELAHLALAGEYFKRDKTLSRELMRRAAEAGDSYASAAYRAFVATGTGAPADWPNAIKLLKAAAAQDPKASAELDLINAMHLDDAGNPIDIPPGHPLLADPQIRLYPGLFSDEECAFLSAAAQDRFSPSVIVDPDTGSQRRDPVRTSDAAAFPLVFESPAIVALGRRLAAASRTPFEGGEPLQILRYRPGEQYRPHLDALPDTDNQRVFTFLVNLNEDYEGGETDFPKIGVRVPGKQGQGLLFRNADAAGRPDVRTEHAGLPVVKGEKRIASRWIHQSAFQPS